MSMEYSYEKLDENYNVQYCPMNDADGAITGHHVIGLRAWFDENPEERKRLGWIKHLQPGTKDIEYNKQTQYLVKSIRQVDEWTIIDDYHVMDKTEEMMLFEEMLQTVDPYYQVNESIQFRLF